MMELVVMDNRVQLFLFVCVNPFMEFAKCIERCNFRSKRHS